MAKILITGANGFIGKRLARLLLEHDYQVYALLRIKGTELFPYEGNNLHLIYGDMRSDEVLNDLPKDLDAAFYLMHSMSDTSKNLEVENQVAQNFVSKLKNTNVKQIIYLSGIVNEKKLSEHLSSRLKVEEIIKNSGISYTILRASIIIGSGSASFEIIRDLVEKLPVMVAPKWVYSRCQPIAIRDILYYLENSILNENCYNHVFDVGGPEVLTFKQVLLQYAEVRKLKRYIIPVPVLTPRLSSYWLVFVTSVPFSLASYLVDSMKMNTVCKDDLIKKALPHTCLTYKEALNHAFLKIEQNEVTSTWMDAWEIRVDNPDIQKYLEVPTKGILKDIQIVPLEVSKEEALRNIWSIGGDKGWPLNWTWELRGLIDKVIGGVGMNRGRRHPKNLVVGDSIDFWRVLKADLNEKHLVLYAEMKMPGEAWLEFKIDKGDLIQTATFRPKGLLGRLYWYVLLPFHYLIFNRMAKKITTL